MKLLSARNGVMISVNTGVPIKDMDKLNLYKIWGISSSCYICFYLFMKPRSKINDITKF